MNHKPLFFFFKAKSGTHGFIFLSPLQKVNLAFKAKMIIEQIVLVGSVDNSVVFDHLVKFYYS